MKKFCVLEQGKTINDDFTLRHKKQFNTDISDFYRLNWKAFDDLNAQVCLPEACWTEGRSVLYDHINKDYEYFVFIDDDILFDGDDAAYKIAETLDEYNPIAGTFDNLTHLGTRSWHYELVPDSDNVHPIACFDLCVHIFSKSFAEVMFPAIYHSSGKSMWYAMYVCHRLFPNKQLAFKNIKTKNSRTGPAEDEKRSREGDPIYENFVAVNDVVGKFEENLYEKGDYIKWNDNNKQHVKYLNAKLYEEEPDKTKIDFSIANLAQIYDIDNEDFRNRQPDLPK